MNDGRHAHGPAERPSREPSLARNVLAAWTGYVLVAVSGFVLPRLIDRHGSREAVGLWDYGWSLTFYVQLLSIGVGSAVNRYVARHRANADWDSLNAIVNSCLALMCASFAIGLVGIATVALFLPRLVADLGGEAILTGRWTIMLLGATAALKLPFSVFNGVIQGFERLDLLNLSRGVRDIILMFLMIGLLLMGYGLVCLATVILAAEVGASVAKIITSRRVCPHLRVRPRYVRWSVLREVAAFGGHTIVYNVARIGLYQGNSMLVAYFLGTGPLAIYSRQRVLVMQVRAFLNQYAQVFVPRSSALHAKGETGALADLVVRGTRYGLFATLPMAAVMLVLGGPVVRLWMGPDYEAPWILAILVLGHLLSMPQQHLYMIMLGMGQHSRLSLAEPIGSIFSLLAAVVALGLFGWGPTGAAIAVALPVTVTGGVIAPLLACRVLRISPRDYVRRVGLLPFVLVLPFAAALLAGRWWAGDDAMRAVVAGMGPGSVILAVVYWKWAIPASMRERIRGLVSRGRGRSAEPAWGSGVAIAAQGLGGGHGAARDAETSTGANAG